MSDNPISPFYKDPESLSNQMKLLRMDFITYTNKVEHEIKMVKNHIKGIGDILKLTINKRPDANIKNDIRKIKEIMEIINR